LLDQVALIEIPALDELARRVRDTARREILPRLLKVGHALKSDGSVLTEADTAMQAALMLELRWLADVPVVGEEMNAEEQGAAWDAGADGLWVIDPIDGTSNFAAGLPCFSVSVAYMRGGRRELGVVYDPLRDESFAAQAGHGATLNGDALPLRRGATELARAIAGVDFKRLPSALRLRFAHGFPFASQRNFGSSALDLCYVAAGRLDVYVHGGQNLWDYAAGALIIGEAGGALSALDGDFDAGDPWLRSVVASSSPALFDSWAAWLRRT
jgi:myo-inositol-1(or 4)-monophosphatase